MDFGEILGGILLAILIAFVAAIIGFLICRNIVCWYWKINARLTEQRKTNELLEKQTKLLIEIRDALKQGNEVSAITAGQMIGLNQNGGLGTGAGSGSSGTTGKSSVFAEFSDDDIPEL